MRFYNPLIILFLTAVVGNGCSPKQKNAAPVRYKNIIVLSDAGKRLNLFRQPERDKAIIEKIYTGFETAARSHFFVNSKDRLQILALPNTRTDELLAPLQDQLYIDMKMVSLKEKARYIKNQRTIFLNRVDSFYTLAASVPEKQYSNTWKFFNEQLEKYLQPEAHYDNYIIVLSDGYSSGVVAPGANYTGSEALLNDARKSGNWEAFLTTNRLKPIVFPKANLYLFFAEMNASAEFDRFPDELKLVQQTWLGWATFCNTSGTNKTLPRITEGSVNNEITAFLQTLPGTGGTEQALNTVNPPGISPEKKQPEEKPVFLSKEQKDPVRQPATENKKQPETKPAGTDKPATTKQTPVKKDKKDGFTIRQDF
jgi:hypothetical protein